MLKLRVRYFFDIFEFLKKRCQWKLETENEKVLFLQFNDLLIAMKGNNRNRRIVDDEEVGVILTLCYIDPVLKGESYFRDNQTKMKYEAAELKGTKVFVEKETEYMRSLRSLKKIFSGKYNNLHVLYLYILKKKQY